MKNNEAVLLGQYVIRFYCLLFFSHRDCLLMPWFLCDSALASLKTTTERTVMFIAFNYREMHKTNHSMAPAIFRPCIVVLSQPVTRVLFWSRLRFPWSFPKKCPQRKYCCSNSISAPLILYTFYNDRVLNTYFANTAFGYINLKTTTEEM